MKKEPLIILTGPTAVGKTELSIELAKAVNGEIISADSMQVYRYMDIGTAKITKEEMQGVKHYLVDEIEPTEGFDVARFKTMAVDAIQKIRENGHIPVVVGGTGFYIQALLYDSTFEDDESDYEYRDYLQGIADTRGAEVLHDMLKEVDPESAEAIHENNVKRVIRALEFYKKTGTKISEHNEAERQKESPYNFAYYVLNMDRERLYQRIDLRVDLMMKNGLLAEVEKLKEMGCTRDMVSMQGLGYKEILDALDGTISLDEAVYIIKRDTRHFAKRQLTWFKRERDVIWVDKDAFEYDEEKILQYMLAVLQERHVWNH